MASSLGAKSRSLTLSVTTRLISSGIDQSRLRDPASMCPTTHPAFAATRAQASVLLMSPGTITASGRSCSTKGSNEVITAAVWVAWEPLPALR